VAGSRHEPQEERAQIDRTIDVVRLREFVVVEDDRRLGREELLRVVPERRGGVAVLHVVPARPGEREPADEPRGLGHAIHAIARLRGEREHDLARAELAPNELDLERRHEVLERVLARVDAEQRHEPIDRRKQDDALGAERRALAVEPEPRRAQARLVEGDAIEHQGNV